MQLKHITNLQPNSVLCTKFFTKYFTFPQVAYHGTGVIPYYCKLRNGVRVECQVPSLYLFKGIHLTLQENILVSYIGREGVRGGAVG
jgi:hypothetical protein